MSTTVLWQKPCGVDHVLLTTDFNCYNVRVTCQLRVNYTPMWNVWWHNTDSNECDKHNIDGSYNNPLWLCSSQKQGHLLRLSTALRWKNNVSVSKIFFGKGIILHHELASTWPLFHFDKHSKRGDLLLYFIKDYTDWITSTHIDSS